MSHIQHNIHKNKIEIKIEQIIKKKTFSAEKHAAQGTPQNRTGGPVCCFDRTA